MLPWVHVNEHRVYPPGSAERLTVRVGERLAGRPWVAKKGGAKTKARRSKAKKRAPARQKVAAPQRTWAITRWLLLRLVAGYIAFNLGLNLILSASQPLRPLRLMTMSRIDERLDAAGLLLRHHFPTHACETHLTPAEVQALGTGIAKYHDVEPALLLAVVETESAFITHAISPVGAMGLAQLMPSTASWLGVEDPFSPRENLDASARYLKRLLSQFKGDVSLALAAYNAGPGTVRRHGGIPPWPETQAYVKKVTKRRERYLSQGSKVSPSVDE